MTCSRRLSKRRLYQGKEGLLVAMDVGLQFCPRQPQTQQHQYLLVRYCDVPCSETQPLFDSRFLFSALLTKFVQFPNMLKIEYTKARWNSEYTSHSRDSQSRRQTQRILVGLSAVCQAKSELQYVLCSY